MELAAAGCGVGAATDMVGKAAAKSAVAPASSRALNVYFMVTPPRRKLPARLLNHRASKKSRTNVCRALCPENRGLEVGPPWAFWPKDINGPWAQQGPSRHVTSALRAELEVLQPLNVIALVGDDLGLPDQSDAQHAHHEDANHQKHVFLAF